MSVVLAATQLASADSISWQDGVGDWFNASNWFDQSNGLSQVPGGGDHTYIENGGTAQISSGSAAAYNLHLDPGEVNLSGGSLSVGDTEYVGSSDTGTFNQTGGTNTLTSSGYVLQVAALAGSTGTYNLSGTGLLSSNGEESVGNGYPSGGASGTFNQTGGTNALNAGASLSVGSDPGAVGVYILSGGTNTISSSGNLSIGTSSGTTGTYSLSGTGLLSVAGIEFVGNNGTGTFNQTGGTNTLTSSGDVLQVAGTTGSTGTYNLSGTGLLSSNGSEDVGDGYSNGNVNGTFNQTGGTNALNAGASLNVGVFGSGAYNLSGGTNTIAPGGFLRIGTESGSIGTYALSGTGSLSVAGTGYVGYIGTGTFTQSGGTASFSGSDSNGNGLSIGDQTGDRGVLNLSSGNLNVAANETVGNNGFGTFIQSGGSNTAGSVYLGHSSGATGTYALSGTGSLSVGGTEYVGFSGNGTFTQTGGTNTPTYLNLGAQTASSSGVYTLQNGSLNVSGYEYLGGIGIGSFNQSGGTNATAEIDLGRTANSSGTYNLSGTGSLSVSGNEFVGYNGTGNFTQTAGTNMVTGALTLAANTGSTGTYNLQGGALTAAAISVNSGGSITLSGTGTIAAGSLTQTGGTLSATSLLLGPGGIGSYGLSGGSASVSGNLQVNAGGSLTQSGSGLLTAGSITLAGGTIIQNTIGSIFIVSLTETGGTLVEDVGVTVDPGSVLNLQGGGLTINNGATLNNVGTFNQTSGTLTENGAFVNSGAATFSGTQSWGPASVFVNLAGTATFNNAINPGGVGPVIVVTGGNVIYNGGSPQIQQATVSGGTLSLTNGGALTVLGALKIEGGDQVQLSGGSLTVGALTINGAGVLNVTNNHFFVNYGSGPDPISTIAGYLASGYAGGAWNGPGIMSTAAQSNPSYGIGYADSADTGNPANLAADQIEIKYTLLGDATLTGTVTGADFTILATHLGKQVSGWDQGDFYYTGTVTGADFTALVTNLGKEANGGDVVLPASVYAAVDAFAAANGLMADVPEPAMTGLLALGIVGALVRRRR
ncbi:MAG: PEP-CTERM sorting domain-containing protein [Tepidisphaeraceae bacterium]